MTSLDDAMREVLGMSEVRFTTTFGLTASGSRPGVLVEGKNYGERRWTKFLNPANGKVVGVYAEPDQELAEVIAKLLAVREEVRGG